MGLNVDDGEQTVSDQTSDSSESEMANDGASISTTKADIVGSSRSDAKGGPKLISTNGNLRRNRRYRLSDSDESDSSDMDQGSIDSLTGAKHSALYNKKLAEQRKKG